MMGDQNQRDKQRQAADRVLNTLGIEPALRQEVLAHPEKAREVVTQRLDSVMADLSAFQPEGEVTGYLACTWTCFFGNWATTKATWSYDCWPHT